MQNVVSFKAPKFKPMPGELTPAGVNGATLPVKIGIAQRAIAACCDLSELLTWKDKLAALAAAAKIARMPEMARDVNRVHKEAIFRMGEILLMYKGAETIQKADGRRNGKKPSARIAAAEAAGLSAGNISSLVRIGKATKEVRDSILADERIRPTPQVMARNTPRTGGYKTAILSDAAALLFHGRTNEQLRLSDARFGLVATASYLRRLPIGQCELSAMTPEEKQRARNLVVEMQEILDDIDRRLGPA